MLQLFDFNEHEYCAIQSFGAQKSFLVQFHEHLLLVLHSSKLHIHSQSFQSNSFTVWNSFRFNQKIDSNPFTRYSTANLLFINNINLRTNTVSPGYLDCQLFTQTIDDGVEFKNLIRSLVSRLHDALSNSIRMRYRIARAQCKLGIRVVYWMVNRAFLGSVRFLSLFINSD